MNHIGKLNIGICDDEETVIIKIQQWIKYYFQMNHFPEPDIYSYTSGEELMDDDKSFDFVFLDVKMPGVNGISTGRSVLDRNPECLIFIITSYEEYIDEAMKINVFRYISKPLNQERLYRNIRDAIKIYTTSNTKILIETKHDNVVVRAPEIIYFEAQGHNLYVATKTEKYITINKLDYWVKTLNMNYFFRTHRSFIVNMEHVVRLDHSLVYLDNGDTAYLTKRNYQNFKRAYLMYLEGARA